MTTVIVAPVEGRERRPWAILRSRSYALLWTAQLASLLGDNANYVAMAWLVLVLTGSEVALGAVLAVAALPRALLMLLGGALSDRLSPRRTMLLSCAARAVLMAAVSALVLLHRAALWELFLASLLLGVISAFFLPARGAALPRVVDDTQLEAGNSLLALSAEASNVIGPALAGIVVAAWGAGAAFVGDAAGYGLAWLCVALLPAMASAPADPAGVRPSIVRDMLDGLRVVWRDSAFRALLGVITVANFFVGGAITVGLPVLAHEQFSRGALVLGISFGAWGVGATAGSLVAGMRPAPRRFGLLLLGAAVWIGIAVGALAVAGSLPLVLAALAVAGVAGGVVNTYAISWLQRRTDPAFQGRVMSLVTLSSAGLEPVALAAAGAVAARSLPLLFGVSGLVVVATALAGATSRRLRDA
ncbi:MAG TPA: MFS transporter [Candidatus Dormibacteraeota bacterium]|jgi:MFS family permease|nr:MFS transporter [Candidatus Dormibacteraeota bacterium]